MLDKFLLKENISKVLRQYGVKRAGLFGSTAHGVRHADSDIDLLVELDPQVSLLGFIALKRHLEESLGQSVDLVEYQTLKPRLRREILANEEMILSR